MSKTVLKAWDICKKEADRLGLILWDVKFVKEGSSWFLRVFIDKDDGIFIEDCENMSRAIDPILDEADFIEQSYYLEVSSPGIGRELSRPEHFSQYLGKEITILLIRPKDGIREYKGILESSENGNITVLINSEQHIFTSKEISKVNLFEEI